MNKPVFEGQAVASTTLVLCFVLKRKLPEGGNKGDILPPREKHFLYSLKQISI
jgi:hypothetical protein